MMDKHDFTERVAQAQKLLRQYLETNQALYVMNTFEEIIHLWLLSGNKQEAKAFLGQLDLFLSSVEPNKLAETLPPSVSSRQYLQDKVDNVAKLRQRIDSFSDDQVIGFIRTDRS